VALDAVHATLARAAPAVPRVSIRIAPGHLVRVGDSAGETETLPLSSLAGARVYALLAIADPGSFVRQMERAGATVMPTALPDHHRFRDDEIARFTARIPAGAMAICTLKDAVKLAGRWPRGALPLWYVSQLVTVERGVGGLEHVLDDLARGSSRLSPTAG